MKTTRRIPAATISRLPLYLRELEELARTGEDVVSSRVLSELTQFTSEQIRKDLAYFGAFGRRGIGYSVRHLEGSIRQILGISEQPELALVGAGRLGTALLRYLSRRHAGLTVGPVFDSDANKAMGSVEGYTVLPASAITQEVQRRQIRLAAITVPAPAAEAVFLALVAGGVRAVLNFAPVKLQHPDVFVHNLDLATELQALAYYGQLREDKADEGARA
ncbi:MAG: redox-sensing transcriptional repressor Rex [Sulfobacillus sp.]